MHYWGRDHRNIFYTLKICAIAEVFLIMLKCNPKSQYVIEKIQFINVQECSLGSRRAKVRFYYVLPNKINNTAHYISFSHTRILTFYFKIPNYTENG